MDSSDGGGVDVVPGRALRPIQGYSLLPGKSVQAVLVFDHLVTQYLVCKVTFQS
jgi:hypothetical protein